MIDLASQTPNDGCLHTLLPQPTDVTLVVIGWVCKTMALFGQMARMSRWIC